MSSIVQHTFSNGLRAVIEPIAGVESVGINWMVPAGHGHDPADRLGLSDLTSEILLRGSERHDAREQADEFDLVGASRSVSTGVRFMRFTATALGDNLPRTLELVADSVRRPRLGEEALAPSRELCLQAIESLADDPQQRCSIAANERHFPEPYGRSGMGTREGLRAATIDDVRAFWGDRARPGGSIIGIAGSVNPEGTIRQLESMLGDWSGETPEPSPAPASARGVGHIEDASNQVQIMVLHDAPPAGHDDAVLERVALSVLSGGMSGRLFTEVREKRGLCYAVNAGYRADRDRGWVSAYVGTTPERAQESLDVLVAELRRINETGAEPGEFERAVAGLKSRIIFSGESSAARAASIATDLHALGRPRTLDELGEEIDGVTLERLNAYLRARSLGELTVQTLGPAPLAFGG